RIFFSFSFRILSLARDRVSLLFPSVFHFFFDFDLTAVPVGGCSNLQSRAAPLLRLCLWLLRQHLCRFLIDFTISRPGLGTYNTNPIKSRHNHLHCRRLRERERETEWEAYSHHLIPAVSSVISSSFSMSSLVAL
ncbi:hypothetical protein Prudu_155S000400, partial [Prunus dulcis]